MIVKIIKRILDFLFPSSCLECDADGPYLCAKCLALIKVNVEQKCPVCLKTDSMRVCASCREPASLDGLIAAAEYQGNPILQRSLHRLKYNFIEELAAPAGLIMAKSLELNQSDFSGFCLVPVPLHKKRYKWRGFNQAELLACEISMLNGLPVLDLLERTTFKKPQMELGREERLVNVEGAFRIRERKISWPRVDAGPEAQAAARKNGGWPVQNSAKHVNLCAPGTGQQPALPLKILLVDDVATTLSTLNECARALKKAGAEVVIGLVAARAK